MMLQRDLRSTGVACAEPNRFLGRGPLTVAPQLADTYRTHQSAIDAAIGSAFSAVHDGHGVELGKLLGLPERSWPSLADLGLRGASELHAERGEVVVRVELLLTTPQCPSKQNMKSQLSEALRARLPSSANIHTVEIEDQFQRWGRILLKNEPQVLEKAMRGLARTDEEASKQAEVVMMKAAARMYPALKQQHPHLLDDELVKLVVSTVDSLFKFSPCWMNVNAPERFASLQQVHESGKTPAGHLGFFLSFMVISANIAQEYWRGVRSGRFQDPLHSVGEDSARLEGYRWSNQELARRMPAPQPGHVNPIALTRAGQPM